MSGFFATHIFDHPRLRDKDVTYYLRLSPDSYIYKPLCYDPFEYFHARNLSSAFSSLASSTRALARALEDLREDQLYDDAEGMEVFESLAQLAEVCIFLHKGDWMSVD